MSGYVASVCGRIVLVRFALLITCVGAVIVCPEKSRGQVVDFSRVVSKWESCVVPFEIRYTAARGVTLPANKGNANPGKDAAVPTKTPLNTSSTALTQQQMMGLVATASQPDSTFSNSSNPSYSSRRTSCPNADDAD